MKILYILGAYKPNMSANGICSDNVIQRLLQDGHEVTALVNATESCKERSVDGNLTIERVKPRLFLRLSEKANSAFLRVVASIINKAQLFFSAPIWPVVSPCTVRRFSNAALKLQKEKDFDVVISVYTPIDTLLAGYAVKKKYPKVQYVPYFLDALAGGWGPKGWSAEKIERHTRRVEEKIAKYADLIVSMESARAYHMQRPLNTPVERCYLDVPTLVPREIAPIQKSEEDVCTILYSGYINYPQRDPIPLLEVLARLCLKIDVRVIFAGTCSKPEIFEPYIEMSKGRICYLGQQTHEQIFELARRADFFLNIGSTNPNTIACKIFEYMTFSKPIIATYSIDNEPSVSAIQKYGHYFCIDERREDLDKIAEELKEFIQSPDREYEPVENLFYNNTPAAFTEKIKGLKHD